MNEKAYELWCAFLSQKGETYMHKICPKCKRRCADIENYCTKCGIELEKEPNRCSENRTTLCSHRTYEDDDIYCAYCGSLTTYALEKQKNHNN